VKFIELKHKEEGMIFNKWLHSRLIAKNKNVLGVELGSTGSGKSYRDLRKAELWYDYHFKEKFPLRNICFGVETIMDRLTSGEMRRGEVLIGEEAGVNLGSLDFQTKISKMFTYVLQSFRSMNVAIFFNLPYLSMLNKTARMLLHYSGESVGIDFKTNLNSCRLKFHQVNQNTGKIYRKYLRINFQGNKMKAKSISYGLPSEYLINYYESEKTKYLKDLTMEFKLDLQKQRQALDDKMSRKPLTEKQLVVYKLACEGYPQKEIAEKLKISSPVISVSLKAIKNHGYVINSNK